METKTYTRLTLEIQYPDRMRKVILETDSCDGDVYELGIMMRNAMLAAGYATESVNDVINEDVINAL